MRSLVKPYSKKATVVAFTGVALVFLVVLVFVMIAVRCKDAVRTHIAVFIVSAVAALVLLALANVVLQKLARKIELRESDYNIRTKTEYAKKYWLRNPSEETYKRMCRVNPEFGRTFAMSYDCTCLVRRTKRL